MNQHQIGKSSSGPAKLIGFQLIQGVPGKSAEQPPQTLPAFPPGYLCGASNVERGIPLPTQAVPNFSVYLSSADPQPWRLPEVLETSLKIVRCKSQVTIEVHEIIPILPLKQRVGIEKCFDAAPGRTVTPIFSMKGTNPRMFLCVSADHGRGRIS